MHTMPDEKGEIRNVCSGGSMISWRPQFELSSVRRGKVPRFDGCSLRDWARKHDSKPFNLQDALSRKISRAEVEAHNESDDLWMVVHGVVFDVTVFQMYHPGGEQILRNFGGKDVTELYDGYHKWVSCENTIGRFAVGVLDDVSRESV